MASTDVIDTLEDIKKWAKAYELLKIVIDGDCEGYICCQCGFNSVCTEAYNLVE